ncbi:MAG: ZIP family metal transporter [Candidatus Omnitrophica bacterium]|nr:ZIP family metal transporter [Candidatus Omnitrophota bacterium]
MSRVWLWALASVTMVGLVSFVGLFAVAWGEARLRRAIFIMVSLAVGAMFGDAFIHLLPEAFHRSHLPLATSLYILAGIFAFFLLEKFLRWRHEHAALECPAIHPVGYMNLVADGLHNLIDGLLVGASYLVSVPVGLGTTLAVLLHEIPQEIGDFGILLQAGWSKRRALWLNSLSATFAILGTVVALAAGHVVSDFPHVILPITAGGFIYIAGSDLVPELHKERQPAKSLVQLLAIGVGVGLMLLLTLLD